MVAIEPKWAEHRLDKVVMAKFGIPWSDTHRYVRQKDIFVARGGKHVDMSNGNQYITKKTNYKLVFGDILCITDKLLQQLKERKEISKQNES